MNYHIGIIDPGDYFHGVKGGSTGFIVNILPYLSKHKITIFGISISKKVPWSKIGLEKNVEYISITSVRYPSSIPMRAKVLLAYFQNLRKIYRSKVDILYVQSPECCLPFLLWKKVPVIYHQHGSANPLARSKYRFARNTFFKKIYDHISKFIYKKADWIIAIDKHCFNQANAKYAKEKTTLLMNAVDTNIFKPNEKLRDEIKKQNSKIKHNYKILYVGRIEKAKGPGILLESVLFLKKWNFYCHTYIVGEGSYKSYLSYYIKLNHLDNDVSLLGRVKHELLPIYYNMADILVLPSEMEGVPMVILESLASGTPVIATNVGGISDLVKNRINGIILDNFSAKNLASSIIKISEYNFDRNEIARTIQHLSSKNFVIAIEIIFEDVMHKKFQ